MTIMEEIDLKYLLRCLKAGYDNDKRNSLVRIEAIDNEIETLYNKFMTKLEEDTK